jgi:hypothetical protein
MNWLLELVLIRVEGDQARRRISEASTQATGELIRRFIVVDQLQESDGLRALEP